MQGGDRNRQSQVMQGGTRLSLQSCNKNSLCLRKKNKCIFAAKVYVWSDLWITASFVAEYVREKLGEEW